MMYVYLDNDWFPNEIFKSAVVYPSEAWTLVKEHDCLKCKGLGKRFLFSSGYKECEECRGTGKFKYYQKIDEDWEAFKKLASPTVNQIRDKESDSPTKPSHYGNLDVFTYAKEHFTVEEVNAYHQITAIKYITRAGKKDGNPYEQDIKKAIVHLQECLKGEEG